MLTQTPEGVNTKTRSCWLLFEKLLFQNESISVYNALFSIFRSFGGTWTNERTRGSKEIQTDCGGCGVLSQSPYCTQRSKGGKFTP